jgi:Lon protease-like protein
VPRLPLFPLGTVLVPGAALPLQIFEPRYIVLLGELVEGLGEPEFGVVAIRRGHEVGPDAARDLHEVGCVARASHAVDIGEGRFLLLSRGSRRFHLDRVDEAAGTAYLTGEVTWLGEPSGDPAVVAELAARLRLALATWAESASAPASPAEAAEPEPAAGDDRDPPQWPDDPWELSYAVGPALRLDLADRQALLAAPDTASRLRLALRTVRREHALAERLRVLPHPPDQAPNLN